MYVDTDLHLQHPGSLYAHTHTQQRHSPQSQSEVYGERKNGKVQCRNAVLVVLEMATTTTIEA